MLKFVMTLLRSVSPYADVLVFVFLMMFIVSKKKSFGPGSIAPQTCRKLAQSIQLCW